MAASRLSDAMQPASSRNAGGEAALRALADALIAALGAQCRVHVEVRALAAAMGEAVVRRDPAEVSRAAVGQESNLGALARADRATAACAAALATALALDPGASLTVIATALEHRRMRAEADGIRRIGSEVVAGARAAQAANAQTGMLLRQALSFTRFALRTLTSTGGSGYTEAGTPWAEARRRFVDARA